MPAAWPRLPRMMRAPASSSWRRPRPPAESPSARPGACAMPADEARRGRLSREHLRRNHADCPSCGRSPQAMAALPEQIRELAAINRAEVSVEAAAANYPLRGLRQLRLRQCGSHSRLRSRAGPIPMCAARPTARCCSRSWPTMSSSAASRFATGAGPSGCCWHPTAGLPASKCLSQAGAGSGSAPAAA